MNRVGRTKDVITLKSWIRQRSVPIDLFRTSCFNVEPHLVIKKLQAQWFGHVADHNVPRKFGGSSLAGWESDAEADTRLGDVITSPIGLVPPWCGDRWIFRGKNV